MIKSQNVAPSTTLSDLNSFTSVLSLVLHFSSLAAEANERAGAGEGFSAGRPGSGGAGPGLVPGPNPQRRRETATGRTEFSMYGKARSKEAKRGCSHEPGKHVKVSTGIADVYYNRKNKLKLSITSL